MTSTEAINKIKVLLGLDVETTKESFEATGRLADGTEIHTPTEFEVGAMLHIIQEDGSMVPAPEGTHTLEGGATVAVDAAGVIISIEEATEETEEEAPEAPATEEALAEEETEESVEMEEKEEEKTMSAEEIVSAVVEAMSPVMKDVEEMKAKLMSLSAEFDTFSDAPAAKPVRNNFAEQAKANLDKSEAAMQRVARLRKELKQK